MPTPMRFFIKVAQKYGNIDPSDNKAVEEWFLTKFRKLPKKDLNAILENLMEYNDEKSIKPDKIVYPSDVPLPLMKDIIPVAGYTWTNLYKKLTSYLRNIIKSGNHTK